MEDQSLPPLFPEGPQGEPIQLTPKQLAFATKVWAANLDFIDDLLTKALAVGGVTEEQAATYRSEVTEEMSAIFSDMEAGRWTPDPHIMEKLRIAEIETAQANLDTFDRLSRAAIEAGEMTEAEVAARRQELLQVLNQALEKLDTSD